MKNLLLFACTILGISAHAQYFTHDYGNSPNDVLMDGKNAPMNGDGFIIGGISDPGTGLPNATLVAFADNGGNINPGTNWVNNYLINIPGIGQAQSVEAKVVEVRANGFGVSGTIADNATGTSYVYYLSLDGLGNVLNTSLYRIPGFVGYTVHSMIYDAASTSVYITGSVEASLGDHQIFILSIPPGGGIPFWSFAYDISSVANVESGVDIMVDPSGTADIIVVGMTDYNNGTTDGFIMRVSATGGPIDFDIYGTPTDDEMFTSVNTSSEPTLGVGFIAGGWANVSAPCVNREGWLLRQNGPLAVGVVWSNTYDYKSACIDNDYWDVLERLDNSGNYYFYTGGNVNNGSIGGQDIILDKINAVTGASVAQHTYGTIGSENLYAMDKNIAGATLGLSLFGTTSNGSVGGSDMTLYKTYFNGVTACNYFTDNGSSLPGPTWLGWYPQITGPSFTYTPSTTTIIPATDQFVCSQPSVPGGSNSRIQGNTSSPDLNMTVQQGENAQQLVVTLQHATTGNATIVLHDVFGRRVYEKAASIQDGENIISVQYDRTANGIYTLSLYQGGTIHTQKVALVK